MTMWIAKDSIHETLESLKMDGWKVVCRLETRGTEKQRDYFLLFEKI